MQGTAINRMSGTKIEEERRREYEQVSSTSAVGSARSAAGPFHHAEVSPPYTIHVYDPEQRVLDQPASTSRKKALPPLLLKNKKKVFSPKWASGIKLKCP